MSEHPDNLPPSVVVETTWLEAKQEIVDLLGGKTPFSADEEQRVQTRWVNEPAHVMDLARSTGVSHAAGNVSYPWAWLAKCCQAQQGPRGKSRANPVLELDRATHSAHIQMKYSLVHYDRWEEVKDELFGERGVLKPWAGDPVLINDWKETWENRLLTEEQAIQERDAREQREWLERKARLKQQPQSQEPPDASIADATSDIPF